MLGLNERAVLELLLSGEVWDFSAEERVRRFVKEANPTWRLSFRLALLAAAWLSPLLVRRPPPLCLYGPEVREAALRAMERSRSRLLRDLLFVLKSVAAFCTSDAGPAPETRSAAPGRVVEQ